MDKFALLRRGPCRDGGIGKRSGLKIRRWQHLASSSLAPGTRKNGSVAYHRPFFFLQAATFPLSRKKRTFPVRCCPWLPRLPACRCCRRHPRNIRPCGPQTRRPPCTPKGREYDSRPFLIRLASHPSMRHDSPRAPVCVPPPDGTRARSPCFALPAASRASPGQSTREDTRARPRRIS